MQKDQLGEWVQVNGPPFGGKTYLITELLTEFQSLSNVNFEQVYDRREKQLHLYKKFYDLIYSKLVNGRTVVSESIYDRRFLNITCRAEMPKPLTILVMPSTEIHCATFASYIKMFGSASAITRAGGKNIIDVRNFFKCGYKTKPDIVFDGTNVKEVIEVVKNHVVEN